MSTAIQPNDELLPGYVLTDRLGSGGYAEVWRAAAPGGIEKAVKIVYGFHDDELASQEMKSLERIKGVRHPFLLSLERFEVVDGRLAILTELADMSLEQRLRQCLADGLIGIPREELLRYMADAADALDYLSQRHGLQHLDIKPENLLILGDHIKVADFGLVKELASRTLNSMVAGMTPTYASPEMFDDRPSPHSDQYSLAIVFQQMLVGTLPFPGRTSAQLAKQHTQAEPQLTALPVQDRPIIARALAKNPDERFSSCREFIEALTRGMEAEASQPIAKTKALNPGLPPAECHPATDDTQRASAVTTRRRASDTLDRVVTQPIRRSGSEVGDNAAQTTTTMPESLAVEEIVDVSVPTEPILGDPQPTLIVAIGGLGIQVACRLTGLLSRKNAAASISTAIEILAFDTDRNELRNACSHTTWESPLCSEDTMHLPLRLPKSYDNSREILAWASRRWLYNIPRSLETRGYRPLGRIALVDHSQKVLGLLDKRLALLATSVQQSESNGGQTSSSIRVVLLAGMGGGTGSGMVIDVANAVRSLARDRGVNLEVHGIMLCTCAGHANSSTLSVANTYALLTELRHTAEFGNKGLLCQHKSSQPFESSEPPFDGVYCVPVGARKSEVNSGEALDTVANYLAIEATTSVAGAIRACRHSRTPREVSHPEPLAMRNFGFASITDQKQELLHDLVRELATAIKRHWLCKDLEEETELSEYVAHRTGGQGESLPQLLDYSNALAESMTSKQTASDSLRLRFGNHASTRFAHEVSMQLQHRCNTRDHRGRPAMSHRDAASLWISAVQVLDDLAANAAIESSVDGKLEFVVPHRDLVAAGSQRILIRLLDSFDSKQSEKKRNWGSIDQLIEAEAFTLLEKQLAGSDSQTDISALLQLDCALATTIARANCDLFQCGCDRRTLVLVPSGGADPSVAENMLTDRPMATVLTAEVKDVTILCEESGISPRTLALRIARVYPGIDVAAHRLLTRTDIDWHSLI